MRPNNNLPGDGQSTHSAIDATLLELDSSSSSSGTYSENPYFETAGLDSYDNPPDSPAPQTDEAPLAAPFQAEPEAHEGPYQALLEENPGPAQIPEGELIALASPNGNENQDSNSEQDQDSADPDENSRLAISAGITANVLETFDGGRPDLWSEAWYNHAALHPEECAAAATSIARSLNTPQQRRRIFPFLMHGFLRLSELGSDTPDLDNFRRITTTISDDALMRAFYALFMCADRPRAPLTEPFNFLIQVFSAVGQQQLLTGNPELISLALDALRPILVMLMKITPSQITHNLFIAKLVRAFENNPELFAPLTQLNQSLHTEAAEENQQHRIARIAGR